MEVTKLMNISRKSKNGFVKSACRKMAKFLGCCVGRNVVIGDNV